MENLSLWGYFIKCLKNFAVCKGRARRKEYWGFTLFMVLTTIGSYIAGLAMSAVFPPLSVICLLYTVLLIIPSFSVTIRRMHDIGKSGGYAIAPFIIVSLSGPGMIALSIAMVIGAFMDIFLTMGVATLGLVLISIVLGLIALASAVLLIVWACMDSQPGSNRYGYNPKSINKQDNAPDLQFRFEAEQNGNAVGAFKKEAFAESMNGGEEEFRQQEQYGRRMMLKRAGTKENDAEKQKQYEQEEARRNSHTLKTRTVPPLNKKIGIGIAVFSCLFVFIFLPLNFVHTRTEKRAVAEAIREIERFELAYLAALAMVDNNPSRLSRGVNFNFIPINTKQWEFDFTYDNDFVVYDNRDVIFHTSYDVDRRCFSRGQGGMGWVPYKVPKSFLNSNNVCRNDNSTGYVQAESSMSSTPRMQNVKPDAERIKQDLINRRITAPAGGYLEAGWSWHIKDGDIKNIRILNESRSGDSYRFEVRLILQAADGFSGEYEAFVNLAYSLRQGVWTIDFLESKDINIVITGKYFRCIRGQRTGRSGEFQYEFTNSCDVPLIVGGAALSERDRQWSKFSKIVRANGTNAIGGLFLNSALSCSIHFVERPRP